MGLVKAAVDSIGGTLADQWKDFHTVPSGLGSSIALTPATLRGTNFSRGSNLSSSSGVISNGSKILVPEGYGLLLVQDGNITGLAMESGGYIWQSDDENSQSLFAGDGFMASLVKQSWQRFKFGGRPTSEQTALFVRISEIPNNKFGTKSDIYWDDAYLNAQVGAICHGTFSVRIIDPIKFAIEFAPAQFLTGSDQFDFADLSNDAVSQLRAEVISSLSPGFSRYLNAPGKANRITNIQQDSLGFGQSLWFEVNQGYSWSEKRGLQMDAVTIIGIQYDASTTDLLRTVQRADALSGNRGAANLQASVAEGLQEAGSVDGSAGILGLGVAATGVGVGALFQQNNPATAQPSTEAASDSLAELQKLKTAFDAGLITAEEFSAAKAKVLGL